MGKRSVILGQYYEQVAADFLKKKGLRCIQRNYRCRHGEIDWIGRDQRHLIFVEVKYRHTHAWVSGLESIDYFKQLKLARTVEHYLQYHAAGDRLSLRFDIVLISGDNPTPSVEWIQNVELHSPHF